MHPIVYSVKLYTQIEETHFPSKIIHLTNTSYGNHMSRTVNMPAFAYIIFTQHFVLRCFYLQISRCLVFQEAQQHLQETLLGRSLVQYFTLTGRPSSRRLSRSRSFISHSTVCSYSPETPRCQWVSLKQKVATVYFLEHHGRHPWHGCRTLSRRLQGAWCREATQDSHLMG